MKYPNLNHILKSSRTGVFRFQATTHGIFATGEIPGLHAERPTLDQTLDDLEVCASLLNEDDPTYVPKTFDSGFFLGLALITFALIGVATTIHAIVGWYYGW